MNIKPADSARNRRVSEKKKKKKEWRDYANQDKNH